LNNGAGNGGILLVGKILAGVMTLAGSLFLYVYPGLEYWILNQTALRDAPKFEGSISQRDIREIPETFQQVSNRIPLDSQQVFYITSVSSSDISVCLPRPFIRL
jgi:hypothetical protein